MTSLHISDSSRASLDSGLGGLSSVLECLGDIKLENYERIFEAARETASAHY